MKTLTFALCALLSLAVLSTTQAQESVAPSKPNTPPLFKGDKQKKDDKTRTLSGVVRDADEKFIGGAVVKLKDTKSLQIRSFITRDDGSFLFQGLSLGVDYEVSAENKEGALSETKTLSVYDTRREAILNLKLAAKK